MVNIGARRRKWPRHLPTPVINPSRETNYPVSEKLIRHFLLPQVADIHRGQITDENKFIRNSISSG
jgi:hypothetical protein